MTVTNPEWAPFHVGMVVHNVEAVADAYGRALGVPTWARYEVTFPAVPWDAGTTDARLAVALGKAAGTTFELIQVIEGECVQGRWLAEHGEGVHHLGLWVPDLRAAIEQMVAGGGAIEWATLRADGDATVHLRPGSAPAVILPHLQAERMAYLGLATGGLTFELCGKAHYDVMQQRTGGDPHAIVAPPPWLRDLGWTG
jgi:catechol 2,3-dioxygenase-like lactoylglutathione lyase family enzyme